MSNGHSGTSGNGQYNSRNATIERPQNQNASGWRPPTEKPAQLPATQSAPPVSATGAALDALILDQATAGKEMAAAFDRCIDKIAELLPDSLKKDASRFVRRAMLYFSRREDLIECTIGSKIKCVLDAAELGLALDGRLCHAVSYNVKVKFKDPQGHERERWEKQAQCQPDYKGLLVVARRCGQIADAYGDVVCENDHFKHGRNGGNNVLEHTFEIAQKRGKVVGAYVIIKFPAGDWRYDLMSIDELDAIQKRSKSGGRGPWATDTNEMRKKTVLRRGLKMYCDDPGVMKALEIEDREYEADGGSWIPANQGKVRVSSLTELFKQQNATGNGNGSDHVDDDDRRGSQQDDDNPPLEEP